MTFTTKGSKKPPGTLRMHMFVYICLGGAGPKEESGQRNPVRSKPSISCLVMKRKTTQKMHTVFFFSQANPCNITSNICIQLPCGVIQQTMVISDKLYIPMVWPGISQTSIGEKDPKSLMIKKRQLGCRNSPWSKISPGWETPTKSRISDDPNQKLGWFSTFSRKRWYHTQILINFDHFVSSSSKFGVAKNPILTKGTEFKDDACDLHWHSTSPIRWRLDIVQLSWLVGRFASFEADGWVWYLTSPPKNSPFHQIFWYLHCFFKACFEVLNDGCFNGMIPKLLLKKHGCFIRTHLKQVV